MEISNNHVLQIMKILFWGFTVYLWNEFNFWNVHGHSIDIPKIEFIAYIYI